ncbi:MAG: phage tail tape measure protein [Pseudomonadota bacterium]
MSQYNVSVLINGNIAGYRRATQEGERATRSFVSMAQREFAKLREFARSWQGQMAGLGATVGFAQVQRNAAQLEKTLTQVRLTAGMTAQEQTQAYETMFGLIRRNGGVIEETVGGFNSLVQAGLKYQEAIKAAEAINIARGVTGANDSVLAGALTVGAANYGFDLAKAGVATEMLDKMAVAGRLGNAELENLSSIFPRVAQRAQSAGMSFDKTLAFIEGLSQVERQPERLATLADSTLRLFTNAKYAKDAEKALGVLFFDAKSGARRDPLAILEDMRKKYQALTTDAQRFAFISGGFQNTDLDTQRGIQALLSGAQLQNMRNFERDIANAGGTLARDLETATNNAADQASRLKNTLREAAEGFARPINDAFARGTKWLLDTKGYSGGQLIGGAAVGLAGVYAASRFLPPLLRGVAGRFGGVGAGVATGKALEAATGVTPVYVTNWAEMNGGGGGLLGNAGAAAAGAASVGLLARARGLLAAAGLVGSAPLGVAGLGATVAGVGAAGAAGYGVGSLVKMGLDSSGASERLYQTVDALLSVFGNEDAQRRQALTDSLRSAKVGGEVTVRVLSDPGVAVQNEVRPFNGTRMTADVGRNNTGAGY